MKKQSTWRFVLKIVGVSLAAAGVLAAIRSLHASIEPLSEGFTPLTPETTSNVRTIELPLKPKL